MLEFGSYKMQDLSMRRTPVQVVTRNHPRGIHKRNYQKIEFSSSLLLCTLQLFDLKDIHNMAGVLIMG